MPLDRVPEQPSPVFGGRLDSRHSRPCSGWVFRALPLLFCFFQYACVPFVGGPIGPLPGAQQPAPSRRDTQFPAECATPTRARPVSRGVGFKDQRFRRAYLLQRQGLSDAAYAIYLDLLCEYPDAGSKGSILAFLAHNRYEAGDIESAIWSMDASLTARKFSGDPTGPKHLTDLLQVAGLYLELGDRARAAEKITEVESILNGPQGRQRNIGTVAGIDFHIDLNLAMLHVRMGNIQRANRALDFWRQNRPAVRSGLAGRREGDALKLLNLARLAGAYADAGHHTEAKKLAEEVIDGSKAAFSRVATLAAIARGLAFMVFARVSIAEGDGAAALRFLMEFDEARQAEKAELARMQQGLAPDVRADLNRMIDSPQYLDRADVAWLYGQAHRLSGQMQEAIGRFVEAVELIERLRGFVSARDRLRFFGRHTGPYHATVSSLLNLGEAAELTAFQGLLSHGRSAGEVAFYFAEAARARLLSEQIAQSRAGAGEGRIPAELAQQERDLRGRADAELRGGIPFEESPAYRERQAFIERLRKEYPDYAALKYPLPVAASQIPLKEGEAVLAYTLLEDRVVVWSLQQGQKARTFQFPVARERVIEAVRALRASLEPDASGRVRPFDAQASKDLYTWLLAEPLKAAPQGSRIVVIPGGTLATIPFEILTLRRPDGIDVFAGQLYTFSYSPSATVLTQQRTLPARRVIDVALVRPLLAVADPVYDDGDPRALGKPSDASAAGPLQARKAALRAYLRDLSVVGKFSRLPGTNQEAGRVASALGIPVDSPDVRLGSDANESDLKSLDLSTYRYVHFATHGVLAEDLPYVRQPALVLSQVGDLKGEDGFLTMEEVLNLKLRADLTVLSACQTGLGQDVSGEGVVGLARAFLYAGSQAVVVSLWRVEDESTALLMGKFYRHISQGLRLAEALNRAKQDLRAERDGRFAHPFYWAPFVLFGSD